MHRMKINRILRILNNTAAFEIKKKNSQANNKKCCKSFENLSKQFRLNFFFLLFPP